MESLTPHAVRDYQMHLVNYVPQLPVTILVTSDLKITIRDEDLTSIIPGDIVVNFVGGGDAGFEGASFTSIVARAGGGLLEEFHHRRPDGMRCGDICVTSSYGLRCKAVFHAACVPFHQIFSEEYSSIQFTRQLFWELMRMAGSWGAKRIVFPIFELDGALQKYHPEMVSEEFCRAARRVSENTHSLFEIKIIIFQNSNLFQAIAKGLQFYTEIPMPESEPLEICQAIPIMPSLHILVQFCPGQLPQMDVYVAFTEVTGPQTETPEYSFSETCQDTAQPAMANYTRTKEVRLGNIQMTCNNGLPSALVLRLGYSSQYSADQYYQKLEILEQMLVYSLEVADNLRASTFALPLDASCLKGFPCRSVFDLVLAIVRRRGSSYKHLKMLRLIIAKDKMCYLMMRKLCDIEKNNKEGVWSLVGFTDPDYQLVAGRFLAEAKRNINWVRVYRNTNLSLLEKYIEKLQEVINRGDAGEVVERTLWHGSSETFVEKICKEGFNPALQGRFDFGKGTHFAKHSNTMLQCCAPDQDGVQYMILARVITGRYRNWPKGSLPDGFDTAVDDLYDPEIFVCPDAHQMFPEYVVTFSYNYRGR